jgi:pimeloyl-ACP methyl ester carboxylesterase
MNPSLTRRALLGATIATAFAICGAVGSPVFAQETAATTDAASAVHHRFVEVDGVKIFYREAGPKDGPQVLLLMGFGGSSFMFRELIPKLATRYHVIAPDLPGFGYTEVPAARNYRYSFANIATTMEAFTEAVKFDRFAMYVFDYGAPTGFRLALRHPERVAAIISQNGNAYVEGLSKAWSPIQAYWKDPSEAHRNELRGFMKIETTRWQYAEGAHDKSRVSPDAIALAQAAMDAPGNVDAQLDLFGDYQSNVDLYPKFQAYIRDHQPPILAVWGNKDPFFLPAGADAYKRDNPKAEVHFVDAGHFALETKGDEVATHILRFLARVHSGR